MAMPLTHPGECISNSELCVAVIQKVQQTVCKNNCLVKSRTLHTVSRDRPTLTILSAATSLSHHLQPTTRAIVRCKLVPLHAAMRRLHRHERQSGCTLNFNCTLVTVTVTAAVSRNKERSLWPLQKSQLPHSNDAGGRRQSLRVFFHTFFSSS